MIHPAPDIYIALHSHEDDLELYVGGRLEPERISVLESHLMECANCNERLSACLGELLAFHALQGTKAEAAHKRSEPRFTAEGDAMLQEFQPLSLDRQKIKIVNVSKNGFGILSPKAILPGTIVQLRINGTVELGSVRYCSVLEDKRFRIGLRLHHGF